MIHPLRETAAKPERDQSQCCEDPGLARVAQQAGRDQPDRQCRHKPQCDRRGEMAEGNLETVLSEQSKDGEDCQEEWMDHPSVNDA